MSNDDYDAVRQIENDQVVQSCPMLRPHEALQATAPHDLEDLSGAVDGDEEEDAAQAKSDVADVLTQRHCQGHGNLLGHEVEGKGERHSGDGERVEEQAQNFEAELALDALAPRLQRASECRDHAPLLSDRHRDQDVLDLLLRGSAAGGLHALHAQLAYLVGLHGSAADIVLKLVRAAAAVVTAEHRSSPLMGANRVRLIGNFDVVAAQTRTDGGQEDREARHHARPEPDTHHSIHPRHRREVGVVRAHHRHRDQFAHNVARLALAESTVG
mmetsp:Transcript_21895/g.50949  ORF Transcript_21895/g.50949 Transcript_21895/m.50949 type:complete len:271 (-) Transcript_21895:785-1597(-)